MRAIVAVALGAVLAGCSANSSIIKSDATSFNEVIEDTTNRLLVLNVLRARDKAPLHFADIPVIRESIQQNATVSTVQFLGSTKPTSATDSANYGFAMQIVPSFEISHLDSKDFNTGISSPIDVKIVKYWLDRGLDRRIVLLLFFSAAEIVERQADGTLKSIRIMNSPRDAIDIIRRTAEQRAALRSRDEAGAIALRCDTQSDFERYLKLVNTFDKFFANSYKERRLLASDLRIDADAGRTLQGYAAMDQGKIQLVADAAARTYSVYALSPEQKIALCFQHAGSASTRKSCYQRVIDLSTAEEAAGPRPAEAMIPFHPLSDSQFGNLAGPSTYCGVYNQFIRKAEHSNPDPEEVRLHGRSVGEMFQFLGDLLQYQEEIKALKERGQQVAANLNTPLTFGYCRSKAEKDADPGCEDVFIRLDGDSCNARFRVSYRDRDYTVANFNRRDSCFPDGGSADAAPKDHTLEVLAVLHQLVGINKSATDIRATPFVQVLP
jgi:hypothetical protein